MPSKISLAAVCCTSEDIVSREIEGEIIIVPLTCEAGKEDDAIYTLNPSGQAIWNLLDGERSLQDIASLLALEYDAAREEIESDILGLVTELVRRNMLVQIETSP